MELRDRIAAAASNHLSDHFICYLEDAQALHLADAVIAELQPELSSLDRLTQWQAAPRLPMHYLMPDGSDPGFTKWKADDE